MEGFRADLHCHTTKSDGTYTPKQLVQHAKAIGLSGLCITDHDTIAAYEDAIPAAKEEGILLGTGVEFSSVHEGKSVHILGYDIDLKRPDLLALCKQHVDRRYNRNRAILQKLSEHGLDVESVGPGRPHIAQALVNAGYVKDISEAFHKWIGDGKPCFDPGEPVSSTETLEVIHRAGGKAFLAHPHLIKGQTFVRRLLALPFDGIEVYYARLHKETPFIQMAKERGLLMSGGSDFHGDVKPTNPLGTSWVDEETFHKIFSKEV